MRISIVLDDETYGIASGHASAQGLTLGAAITELIRRGHEAASVPPRSPASEVHVFASRKKPPTAMIREVRE